MLPAARRRISICLRGTQETLIYDDADIAEALVYMTRRVHQFGVCLLSKHCAGPLSIFRWIIYLIIIRGVIILNIIVSHCRSTKRCIYPALHHYNPKYEISSTVIFGVKDPLKKIYAIVEMCSHQKVKKTSRLQDEPGYDYAQLETMNAR